MAVLNMNVWYPAIVIGIVTGGNRLGSWLGQKAQLVGGIVLRLIGVRILSAHLSE